MAAVKAIPASEDGYGARLIAADGQEYVLSLRNADRRFTLWKVVGGGYEKLAVAKDNPAPLMELVFGERE